MLHYYTHNINDYAGETAHLTLIEHGAYRKLLDLYYKNEGPIAGDIEQICRLLIARSAEEKAAVAVVLDEFFEKTEDGYRRAYCDQKLHEMHAIREKARAAGKKSAEVREAKRTTPQRKANGNPTDVERPLEKTQRPLESRCEKSNESATSHKPLAISHKPGSTAAPSEPSDAGAPPNAIAIAPAPGDLLQNLESEKATSKAKPASKAKPKAPAKTKEEPESAPAWVAYRDAYEGRYKRQPITGPAQNAAMAYIVKQIGAETATGLVAWYVSQNDPYFDRMAHDLLTLKGRLQASVNQYEAGLPGGRGQDRRAPEGLGEHGRRTWENGQRLKEKLLRQQAEQTAMQQPEMKTINPLEDDF